MAQNPLRSILIALSASLADSVLEVGAYLERFGFEVDTAESATEVLQSCGHHNYHAVVFDSDLAAELGADMWLEKLRLISPTTAPVAIGEQGQLELLRKLSQQVDGDYVLLPLHLGELKSRLRRLAAARSVGHATVAVAADDRSLAEIVGRSACMQQIRDRIRKVAGLTSTVLVTGESGVGKELIARGIHKASPRHARPFIALNCSALPEALLESELFGHERGAFTGAATLSKGKFELAHGGTLFLDEIGDMNAYTQAKILRALEEREFMRVGGAKNIRVDVRVVAATNADLKRRMAEGKFREDLYYRLKVITIEVPPLRARLEDIPELARALVDRFARGNQLPPKRLTDDALSALASYRWPGNIRELRNTLESMSALAPGDVIDIEDMPPELLEGATEATEPAVPEPAVAAPEARGPKASSTLGTIEDMERRLIRDTLARVGGNRTKAAGALEIGVRTLQRKIKRYGLESGSE